MSQGRFILSEWAISLEEEVQMDLRIREATVWATPFKLILEMSGSKVSRIEGFSLDSPHLEMVFSFSDIHSALSFLSNGICEALESALWVLSLSSRHAGRQA